LKTLSTDLHDQNEIEDEICGIVSEKSKHMKITITIIALMVILGSVAVSIFFERLFSIAAIIIPVVFAIIMMVSVLWNKEKPSIISLMPRFESYWRKKQNMAKRFDQQKTDKLKSQIAEIELNIESTAIELTHSERVLTIERDTLDSITVIASANSTEK
jgi:hypothetical protein